MIKEDGTVVFEGAEQTEIDRIVEERLARERRTKFSDYEDAKGILEELNAYGYQGDAKSVRQAVKAQREEFQRQQELEELQQQAKDEGTSPELLKEMRELKAELAELKKDKEEKIQEAKRSAERKEKMDSAIKEFEETYPDVDLEKLNSDEDFIEFLKDSNPNLSLVKVYERYEKYTNGAVQKATAKIQSNIERSTSSGKGKGSDNAFGLTADQRRTVDDWNAQNPKMKMTYQEFAQNVRK